MSAILILGAANWANGPSPALLRRTKHAAKLWRERQDHWIVACGGIGTHPPAEASVMSQILFDEGVNPGRIFQECHSTNTLENIHKSLPFLRLLGTQDVTIVTDAYHAKRALMVARHFGLNAKTSCPEAGSRKLANIAKQQTRESAARLYYRATLHRVPKEE